MLHGIMKILRVGGWVPLALLGTHILLNRVLHVYDIWPSLDIPMHFSGGMAIAFFISRCYQFLPREGGRRSRVKLLELVLIVSLTATVAVFWEFAEFTEDQLLGTNEQVSLMNTMQDMAMGMAGAMVFALIRARQLGVGAGQVIEIAGEWVRGRTAPSEIE